MEVPDATESGSTRQQTVFGCAMVLLVLSAYLFVLAISLPEGVNQIFANRSWPRFLVVSIALFAFFLFSGGLTKPKLRRPRSREDNFTAGDLTLLLLPLTPVVQYILLNQDMLSVSDALISFVVLTALAASVVFVVPNMLRRFAPRSVLMPSSLALIFVLVNMASLTREFTWHRIGSLNVQLTVFAVAFAMCLVLYKVKKTLLYVFVAAYSLSGVLITVFAEDSYPKFSNRSRLYDLAAGMTAKKTPDIYLLTYDAYVENETMLQYGIDNSAQEDFLRTRGFQLYKGMYSVGGGTIVSMGQMLSPGGDNYEAVSGSGDVQRILKQQGYEMFGIFRSHYFFRRSGSKYDVSFPPLAPPHLLLRAVFEGEFRFDIDFEDVSMSTFLDKKRAVMRSTGTRSTFLHTHTGPGHSPRSGGCRDDETELFEERLAAANIEMREDIDTILAGNDSSIIIVNGDHGPYLTKNCSRISQEDYPTSEISRLDVQDRLGTFLAIRWPDSEHTRFDDISILQDVFPTIFAYMFDNPSLLDGRIKNPRPEVNGVTVENGVIVGGAHAGERLFVSGGGNRTPGSLRSITR